MKFKKIERTIFGDIYFLQILGDKIVLNDNYEGLYILNSNLFTIKKIRLIQDLTIYNSVVISEKEVLLNCIENDTLFIVNIETDEVKKMYFPNLFKNEILFRMVKKEENTIIFKTYSNNFFKMDMDEMSLKRVDSYEDCNGECNDIENSKGYATHVVLDDINVYMNEKNMLIVKDKEKHEIFPDKGFSYIGVKFLDKNVKQLIVLSSRNDNSRCKILSYSFDK